MLTEDRQYLHNFINRYCIVYRTDQPILRPNGKEFDWIMDMRPLLLDQQALKIIAADFWDKFGDNPPFQLACMEISGIPLMTAIIMTAPREVTGTIVRKRRKRYGLGNHIEGRPNNLPLIVVDDLFASGTTMGRVMTQIGNSKQCKEVYVIVDAKSPSGLQHRKEMDLKVHTIFEALKDFNMSYTHENCGPVRTIFFEKVWESNMLMSFDLQHMVPKSGFYDDGERLITGDSDGKMTSFMCDTGKIAWQFSTGKQKTEKGIRSTPAFYNNKIYFGDYNGYLNCLDAYTGAMIFRKEIASFVGSTPLIIPEANLLLIGLEHKSDMDLPERGGMAAYTLDKFSLVWHMPLMNMNHGTAVRYENTVIWGTCDGKVLAMDFLTGRIIWEFFTKDEEKIMMPPAVHHNWVGFSGDKGGIYCLDARSGRVVVQQHTDNICFSTPLFVEHRMICGSGNTYLYDFNLNEETMTQAVCLRSNIFCSPVVSGEEIYVGQNAGSLFVLNRHTLHIKGEIILPEAICNPPIVKGDKLYIKTFLNQLYCYQKKP